MSTNSINGIWFFAVAIGPVILAAVIIWAMFYRRRQPGPPPDAIAPELREPGGPPPRDPRGPGQPNKPITRN